MIDDSVKEYYELIFNARETLQNLRPPLPWHMIDKARREIEEGLERGLEAVGLFRFYFIDTIGEYVDIDSIETLEQFWDSVDYVKARAVKILQPQLEAVKSKTQEKREGTGQETLGAGATETPKTNTFCKKGDKWVITYMGEGPFYLDDYKGLHYIRHLLLNPSKTFEALELVRLVKGTPSGESIPCSQLGGELDVEDSSISYSPGTRQEILDSTAKEDIERMKEKLKEKLEEAEEAGNIEEKEESEKKISELERYLSSSAGLPTRPRSFIDGGEKARKAVSNAITRSRREIKNHSETLYEHLKKFITSGSSLSYNPTEPTPWE